jgi:uncharacterized membrane protein
MRALTTAIKAVAGMAFACWVGSGSIAQLRDFLIDGEWPVSAFLSAAVLVLAVQILDSSLDLAIEAWHQSRRRRRVRR